MPIAALPGRGHDGFIPCLAARRPHVPDAARVTPVLAQESRPIGVLIVDDHPMLREGVAAVIGMQRDMVIVGEASSGEEAVVQFAQLQPDIVLMDLRMPGMPGVKAIEQIRAAQPDARIIVLTTYSGDVQALQALRAGAAGFLLKSGLRRDLLNAIRTVHEGRRHLNPEVAQEIALHAIDEALSPRETEILQLIAGGLANKQIAWKLQITEETVKWSIKNIFGKLHVSDRTHAVTKAAKRGIIEL